MNPFLGNEAIANRALSRGVLRSQYTAVLPNIYIHKGAELTLEARAHAAWLWCGETGVIAGRTAAGLYLNPRAVGTDPIELIALKSRHPADLIVRNERISVDEITVRQNLPGTSPARTALDLARQLDRDSAVRILDIDPGAASPEETRVRLLLSDVGHRPTHTQIRVTDGFTEAVIAMGWPALKVGVECDHPAARDCYAAEMAEFLQGRGWLVIHVRPNHTDRSIVGRTLDAYRSRLRTRPGAPR